MSDNPLGFRGNAAANTVEVGDKVRVVHEDINGRGEVVSKGC